MSVPVPCYTSFRETERQTHVVRRSSINDVAAGGTVDVYFDLFFQYVCQSIFEAMSVDCKANIIDMNIL
jgi:hypothetical protein